MGALLRTVLVVVSLLVMVLTTGCKTTPTRTAPKQSVGQDNLCPEQAVSCQRVRTPSPVTETVKPVKKLQHQLSQPQGEIRDDGIDFKSIKPVKIRFPKAKQVQP